jgi:hypothetical protein
VWEIHAHAEDDINDYLQIEQHLKGRRRTFEDNEGVVGAAQPSRRPIVKFQASKGKLYSIGFIDLPLATMLAVCGDEGVLIYSWRDISDLKNDSATVLKPVQHLKPYKSPNVVEINDFDYDEDNHLYGASGDAFGCYKWDLESEKILKTYPSKNGGYLHTLKVLPSSSSDASHSTLLFGGEDGILGVWDRKQDKLIENIDVKEAMNNNAKIMSSTVSSGFTHWTDSNIWISHIHSADSSNFWNLCGGSEGRTGAGGYVTCWHGPTRTLAAGCSTRETPNRMELSGSALATVANECVVSCWSRTELKRESRLRCTPPCSYAIAVRESDGLMAVGGYSNRVDILDSDGAKYFSLSIV